MTAAFDRVRLGDVARIRHGFAFEGAYFVDRPTKYVLLTPGNFHVGGGFKSDKLKFYDGPVPDEYVLSPGALVVTMTDLSKNMDTLGYPALVPELPEGRIALHNQRIGLVEVTSSSVDKYWLFYRLRGSDYRSEVLASSSGTTVHHTSPSRIERFEFVLPPIEEQRTVAATLGALDDKIESNRRATVAGESLIRALVESALYASEGEDGTLGDYCRLVKAPVKLDEINADDNYIGLEHMPRGSIFLTEWEKAEGLGSNKTAFQRGDVLFGKLRPYFKKVGVAPVNGVCSTDILAIRPKDPRDLALIAAVAASDALIDSLSAGSTGTRMPRASWKDLAAWQVPVLTPTERAELAACVAPLAERLEQLMFESRRLAALRDALLPELISGRMDVLAEGAAA